MTREELIERLFNLATGGGDEEADHVDADNLLLEYINDAEVTIQFKAIAKWYA